MTLPEQYSAIDSNEATRIPHSLYTSRLQVSDISRNNITGRRLQVKNE